MKYDWSSKVVLITGASSGIGHALALELGRRGAAVGLFARRAELLIKLAEEIERVGGKALALPGDVRQAVEIETAAARVRQLWGRIDILVANSGVSLVSSGRDVEAKDVADVITVNTLGTVNSVAAVLPDMVARQSGQLVAISSLAAFRGLPKSGAYSASKAAVSTFFESLRVDLRGKGVDVTIIHPGFVRTPLTANRKGKLLFLMEVEDAVRLIIRAIERRRRTYAFPWQLAGLVKLLRLMPNALYDRLGAHHSFRE